MTVIVHPETTEEEVRAFVKRELARGVIPEPETPYIWADYLWVSAEMVERIIKEEMGNDNKIHFKYGAGGALVCDVEIPNITQDLLTNEHGEEYAESYGGRYFVAESMNKSAARRIAELLGGVLDE